MSQFHGLFFEETAQHLAAIEAGLACLDPATPDPGVIAELHRFAHSIKGASATFGFDEIATVGRALSDALDRARKGEVILGRDGISTCCSASRVLGQQLSARRDGMPACDGDARMVVAQLAAIGMPANAATDAPVPGAGTMPVYDLRFSIARGAVSPELAADSVLEQLATLGTVAVVIRPQGGGVIGDWRIGLRSHAAARDVRAILELIATPDSVRVSVRDGAGDAQDAVALASAVGPSSPTLDRMEAMAREIRDSSAQIAALAVQMEQLTARHAVLLEEAAELGRRFVREARLQGAASVANVPTSAADGGALNARRRPATRAPVPKVARSAPLRSSLTDEWEDS